jgi:hypothetical protein
MLVVRRAIAHSGQPEFGEACLGKSKNPVMTREVGVLIESFEKPGDQPDLLPADLVLR